MTDFQEREAGRSYMLWLVPLVLLCTGASFARESDLDGLSFAPFSPDNRDSVSISDAEALHLGHEPPPMVFNHFVSFEKRGARLEASAPLPVYGRKGEGYSITVTGGIRVNSGGRAELAILKGSEKMGKRIFKKDRFAYFKFPVPLQGGESYRVALVLFPGTEGRMDNLRINFPSSRTIQGPGMITYYKPKPLPPRVIERNTLRYLDALHRDLTKISQMIYYGFVGLVVFLVLLIGARWLFRRSKRPGLTPKKKKLLKMSSFSMLSCCGIMLLALAVEFLYRIQLAWRLDEPVLMTYPLGFNLDNLTFLHYERDNFYRYDDHVDGLTVPYISRGYERLYYRDHYYRAFVNEGGFRGELKPLFSGAKSVCCIGGSATYGMNNEGETYPDFLQAALDREAPGEFVVINLGIPGLSASYFLGRIKHILNLTPDYIVVYAGFNDLGLHNADIKAREQSVTRRYALYTPAHYSLLCRNLLARQFTNDKLLKENLLFEFNRLVPADLEASLLEAELYANAVDKILDYARSVGAEVIYMNEYAHFGGRTSREFFDSVSSSKPGDHLLKRSVIPNHEKVLISLSLYQLSIRKLVLEKGYGHVRCFEPHCFDEIDPRDLMLDWVHLNKEGNRLLGEYVAEQLLKK